MRLVTALALGTALSTALCGTAYGQALTTTGPSLASDTFEQIDSNGVDLINGTFHLEAPVLSVGNESNAFSGELQWNGRMWELNIPSIWTDGDRNLFVNNGRRVDEFDFTSGVGWVPLKGDGSVLTCTFWDSDRKVMSHCDYGSHDGIAISFSAPSPTGSLPQNFSPALGNVNANAAVVTYPNGSFLGVIGGYTGDLQVYTSQGYGFQVTSSQNPAAAIYLQKFAATAAMPLFNGFTSEITHMNIDTPGLTSSNRFTKNMLMPKDTVQSMTDPLQRKWYFTFNSDGNMTGVRKPSSATNNLILGYDGDHRVTSFNNGVATWLYSYTSSGSNGTTTVTDPNGGQTIVTYVKKKGYARTVQDPLQRVTTYTYDSHSRVESITYPELNSVFYGYDPRGNVVSKTVNPKPGSGLTSLTTMASYSSSCASLVYCNLPLSITDAKGNQTDITYNGYGQPLTITKPAAVPGGVRPQTRMTYSF